MEFLCTVCGYRHKGETQPTFCPICAADHTHFVEMTPENEAKYSHLFLDAF
jgi:rubrerythrin